MMRSVRRTAAKVVVGAAAVAAGYYAGTVVAERLIDASPMLQRALLERVRSHLSTTATTAKKKLGHSEEDQGMDVAWDKAKIELAQHRACFQRVTLTRRGGRSTVVVHADRVELHVAPLWRALLCPMHALEALDVHGVLAVVDSRSHRGDRKTHTEPQPIDAPAQRRRASGSWVIRSTRISNARLTVFAADPAVKCAILLSLFFRKEEDLSFCFSNHMHNCPCTGLSTSTFTSSNAAKFVHAGCFMIYFLQTLQSAA